MVVYVVALEVKFVFANFQVNLGEYHNDGKM